MKKAKPSAPPYRPENLLSADQFVGYCKRRGVRTNKEELEFYHKIGLIAPAVAIYRPIVKSKDTSDKPIYVVAGISFPKMTSVSFLGYRFQEKPNNILGETSESCQFYEPAKKDFVPWSRLDQNKPVKSKKKSDLGKPILLCYSPEQIFALAFVQTVWRVTITGAGLTRTAKRWIKVGETIRKDYEHEDKGLRKKIDTYYKAIRLYYEAETLWHKTLSAKVEWLEEYEDMTPDDFYASLLLWEKDKHPTESEAILSKIGIEPEEVVSLAELFAHEGFTNDPNIEIRDFYRSMMSIAWIEKQKGSALFCEDYYRVADRLLWLIQSLLSEPKTVKDFYHDRGWRLGEHCIICSSRVRPSKRGGRLQKTCANKKCTKEWDRRRKRKERRKR